MNIELLHRLYAESYRIISNVRWFSGLKVQRSQFGTTTKDEIICKRCAAGIGAIDIQSRGGKDLAVWSEWLSKPEKYETAEGHGRYGYQIFVVFFSPLMNVMSRKQNSLIMFGMCSFSSFATSTILCRCARCEIHVLWAMLWVWFLTHFETPNEALTLSKKNCGTKLEPIFQAVISWKGAWMALS